MFIFWLNTRNMTFLCYYFERVTVDVVHSELCFLSDSDQVILCFNPLTLHPPSSFYSAVEWFSCFDCWGPWRLNFLWGEGEALRFDQLVCVCVYVCVINFTCSSVHTQRNHFLFSGSTAGFLTPLWIPTSSYSPAKLFTPVSIATLIACERSGVLEWAFLAALCGKIFCQTPSCWQDKQKGY